MKYSSQKNETNGSHFHFYINDHCKLTSWCLIAITLPQNLLSAVLRHIADALWMQFVIIRKRT